MTPPDPDALAQLVLLLADYRRTVEADADWYWVDEVENRIKSLRARSGAQRSEDSDRIRVLEQAVGNCFMMAKREIARLLGMSNYDAKALERWQHVQRFCETTGSKSSILRGQLPTKITEGESPADAAAAEPDASGLYHDRPHPSSGRLLKASPVSASPAPLASAGAETPTREERQDNARREALIDRVVLEVAELPDRTSPDDWPEAMLVTASELRAILAEAIYAAAALPPTPEPPK